MRPAIGAQVIEAIAALVALLLASVAGLWVQTGRVRDAQRNAATAAARAKLQGKRVVVEADRRTAAEAAAAVHKADIAGADGAHAAAMVEVAAEAEAIAEADSAEDAAAALRRAFDR